MEDNRDTHPHNDTVGHDKNDDKGRDIVECLSATRASLTCTVSAESLSGL